MLEKERLWIGRNGVEIVDDVVDIVELRQKGIEAHDILSNAKVAIVIEMCRLKYGLQ